VCAERKLRPFDLLRACLFIATKFAQAHCASRASEFPPGRCALEESNAFARLVERAAINSR
jgi:hypothetical protein